jgi:hypothetical protein
MWYNTNNPYTRRAVAFCAILMVTVQFQNSSKVLEPILSIVEDVGVYMEPKRVENIRKQIIPILPEKKEQLEVSLESGPNTTSSLRVPGLGPNKDDILPHSKESTRSSKGYPEPDKEGEIQTEEEQSSKNQKPLNVLIMYPDDWRHDDIGGVAPIVRTPFLNELARSGIRFTHNMVRERYGSSF